MFARLGGWCHDHRRVVAAGWLAGLLLLGGVLGAIGGSRSQSAFNLPNVESKRGMDILDQGFGGRGTGQSGTIVFRVGAGTDPARVRAAMVPFLRRVAKIPDVAEVGSPYAPGGERQLSARPGRDVIGYATVDMAGDQPQESLQRIAKAIRAAEPRIPGLEIDLGGDVFAAFQPPSSELLGLAFAVVILILAFGSVLAMGLPVGVALGGISVGTVMVGFLSRVLKMPDFASTLGIMIGLGVGIDYALFIVTRFREQQGAGHDVGESTRIALDTAGRAVLFAGTTVVISLLGMLIMGISFVTGLAVGAATVVAVTMAASLTLLPALLGFAGSRVEVTRWRGLLAAGLVAVALVGAGLKVQPLLVGVPLAVVVLVASLAFAPLRRTVPRRAPRPVEQTAAYRWSRLIQRRPWPAALAGVVLL
ncbi:MAG: MMPL family transporter, partial [Actinobacteria bacterium]|nr:MMPL family transporter [Actinomycetota bacterium]